MHTAHDIIHQSAVAPYRRTRHGVEIALITAGRGNRWLIPKGHLEPGMTPQASAEKEAYEEAGLVGLTDRPSLGWFEYRKRGRTRRVEVYPMIVMQVLDRWPEHHLRQRQWADLETAAALVCYPGLGRCLERMREQLFSTIAA